MNWKDPQEKKREKKKKEDIFNLKNGTYRNIHARLWAIKPHALRAMIALHLTSAEATLLGYLIYSNDYYLAQVLLVEVPCNWGHIYLEPMDYVMFNQVLNK